MKELLIEVSESSEAVMVHGENPPAKRCAVQKRGGPGEKPGAAQAPQLAVEVSDEPARVLPEAVQMSLQNFYRRAGRLRNLFRVLTALGLELAAGLALHEAMERIPAAWTMLRAQSRLRSVRRRMAVCAAEMDRWKHEPDIRRNEFTRGVLLEQGQQSQPEIR